MRTGGLSASRVGPLSANKQHATEGKAVPEFTFIQVRGGDRVVVAIALGSEVEGAEARSAGKNIHGDLVLAVVTGEPCAERAERGDTAGGIGLQFDPVVALSAVQLDVEESADVT